MQEAPCRFLMMLICLITIKGHKLRPVNSSSLLFIVHLLLLRLLHIVFLRPSHILILFFYVSSYNLFDMFNALQILLRLLKWVV